MRFEEKAFVSLSSRFFEVLKLLCSFNEFSTKELRASQDFVYSTILTSFPTQTFHLT